MKKFLSLVVAASLMLGGCASQMTAMQRSSVGVAETTRSVPIKGIREVQASLHCIRDSGVYRTIRAAVSLWADGTGKANYVAPGGPNGTLLPQGTTASFITQALIEAGVTAQNFYSMGGEGNIRQFSTQRLQTALATQADRNEPHIIVNGSWLTLDFDNSTDTNMQVAGIGPIVSHRGAQVAMGIEIVKPGLRTVLGQSILKRRVFSTTVGASVGRVFGNTLVTGESTVSVQQAIQLESAEYMVALGVAEALSKNPNVPQNCRTLVQQLLAETPTS